MCPDVASGSAITAQLLRLSYYINKYNYMPINTEAL
jgi:hypothetical protein